MENSIKTVLKNLAANKKSILKRIGNTGVLLMGIIVGSVFVYSCGGGGGGGSSASGDAEARIAALEAKLAAFTDDGANVTISGRNLIIVSGSGSTSGTINGKGNLIIGYNEDATADDTRSGSHNLVIGSEHSYSSYGGLVAGFSNTISAQYASVSGGITNTASGNFASVSGGITNIASGNYASVSGGAFNTANGSYSSVSGGRGCAVGGTTAKWIVGLRDGTTGGCDTVTNNVP